MQYAYARICSVIRQLNEKNLTFDFNIGCKSLHKLNTNKELIIIKLLLTYKDTLLNSAIKYEPHLITNYLYELASLFHSYYNSEQFLVEDNDLRNARICLILSIKQIIKNCLFLIGVSAPEMM